MKRVAYLTSQYPATSHTFIRREVDALRRKGLELRTFSVRRPAKEELLEQADELAFQETSYILPVSAGRLASSLAWAFARNPIGYFRTLALALRHRPPGIRYLLWSVFYFLEATVLARMLHAGQIDHLHNHFANSSAIVGLLTSNYLGLPWSLTLHGISETDYPAGLLLREKLAHAEFVACASWFGRAQAMRVTSPDQWHKFRVVRCGVEPRKLPSRRPSSDGPFKAIAVGRLSAEKGQHGLLSAFNRVIAEGHEAELMLVGDGPDKDALVKHAEALGLSGIVTFVGRLPESETLKAIAQADLLVLPSFMEGLPVVLMEAMALEVPVIASCVAGIPELVIHDESGLLFAPSDWTELASLITQSIRNPSSSARRAAAGARRILREFDVDVATEPLLKCLLGLALTGAQRSSGGTPGVLE